ncbi:MAG TPA: EamA family transporter [Methylomirabilota bacterium]|nr:EamA family transporter [Methylomirabilota bacterium]
MTGPSGAPAVSGVRYTLLALLFCHLWSGAFVAVKIGLASSPPLFLMASRFLIAGALLLAWAWGSGRRMPTTRSAWGVIVLLGLLNHAIYLSLTAIALRHLSAGMGAIFASTNPLMLAVVAPWFLGERLTGRKVVGLVIAFGGVLWVMASRVGPDNQPSAMALLVFSIMFLVAGTIVFKRIRHDEDLVVLNAGQLFVAGVALIVPSVLFEPLDTVRLTPSFLATQLYLIVGVSWVAMLIWFWLLRHGDATRASAWFFLNPVIGVFLGATLLGEPLGVHDFLGAATVALGIYLVQRG